METRSFKVIFQNCCYKRNILFLSCLNLGIWQWICFQVVCFQDSTQSDLTNITAMAFKAESISETYKYLWCTSLLYFFMDKPSMLAGRSAWFWSLSLQEVVIINRYKSEKESNTCSIIHCRQTAEHNAFEYTQHWFSFSEVKFPPHLIVAQKPAGDMQILTIKYQTYSN